MCKSSLLKSLNNININIARLVPNLWTCTIVEVIKNCSHNVKNHNKCSAILKRIHNFGIVYTTWIGATEIWRFIFSNSRIMMHICEVNLQFNQSHEKTLKKNTSLMTCVKLLIAILLRSFFVSQAPASFCTACFCGFQVCRRFRLFSTPFH